MPANTDAAFLALADFLRQRDYTFICPTPESQDRVVSKRVRDRDARHVATLEDFFGWSLSCHQYVDLPSDLRIRSSKQLPTV